MDPTDLFCKTYSTLPLIGSCLRLPYDRKEAEEVGVFTGETTAHKPSYHHQHATLSQAWRTQPTKAANQRLSSAGLARKPARSGKCTHTSAVCVCVCVVI